MYLNITNAEDYLIKQAALQNGLLPFPIMGPRKTYFFINGVDTINETITLSNKEHEVQFTDEVLNIFYDYYLDERDRIKEARKVLKEYTETKDEETKEYLKKQVKWLLMGKRNKNE